MEIEILYSDPDLLAVNKPAGLLTIPDGYHPELPCAVKLLQESQGQLWVVHRLDKETSGILLFARNARAHKYMNEQFQNRQVQKIYRAIIVGCPNWEQLEINLPLKVDGDRQHRTTVDPRNGKPAQTGITVISRYPGYSYVEAHPHTGYTHQIRAHLSASGFPILSDPLYDRNSAKHAPILSRLGLHACQISFTKPDSASPITSTAPYPDDFQGALANLDRLNY